MIPVMADADGLDNSAECTNEEGLPLAVPRRPQGHGDDSTLGDILDGYSKGKGQGGGHVEIGLKGAGYCNAHGHPFREIVDGHGQSQLCGTGKAAAGALGLTANVDVRRHVVYEKQERKAAQKTRKGWADRTHLHGRNEEGPHGCRHHDAGRKAKKRLL